MTSGPAPATRGSLLVPRVLVGALCLVATGAVVAVAVVDARPSSEDVAATASGPREGADREAVRVLRQWDAARARAWARSDQRALQGLYTPDSEAGRRDVAMLRRWRGRGLRVEQMRTQVRSVEVVRHGAGRLVLVVTDRLAGAVAVGQGRRAALPGDGFTTRQITLRRGAGRWRVASVLPAPSGVR